MARTGAKAPRVGEANVRTIVIVILLLGAAGAGLWYGTFRAQPLPVDGRLSFTPPRAAPPETMRLSVLHAGRMEAWAAMAYRGGALSEVRTFGMDAVLIEHPAGDLLIDTGFGRDVGAHFKTTPALMQHTSSYIEETPVVDQLRAAGRDPDALAGVILTHAHWDHVSGLADFGDVPVWVTAEEMDFIASDDPGTVLARQLSPDIQWQVYDFPDGPYLGFPASRDVHGDGAVVVVPAGGHTPGGVIIFVAPPRGPRYAFIGDIAWQREGIAMPAERPWLMRDMVDVDAARVRDLLVRLHQMQQALPTLIMVPAHDRRVMAQLPPFHAGAATPR